MGQRLLTDEQEADVVRLYEDGMAGDAIAETMFVGRHVIYRTLRKTNAKIRSNPDAHRSHSLNEHAFDEWTPEASYWAGFLFADGCVYQDGKTLKIQLGLSLADELHVLRFRDFIGSSHPIRRLKQKCFEGCTASMLCVRSNTIGRKLQSIGIVKGRGPVLDPFLIQSRDFWRGVVDGDGCLYWQKPPSCKRKVPGLFVVGHAEQLAQFANFVKEAVPSAVAAIRKKPGIHEVRFGGTIAKQVSNLLYDESTTHLPRKKAVADAFALFVGRTEKDRRCEVEGCNKQHAARGMCHSHYSQKWQSENKTRRNAMQRERIKRNIERHRATQRMYYHLAKSRKQPLA